MPYLPTCYTINLVEISKRKEPMVILLVEDEALIAMATADTLERHGYEVLTEHSGEAAIRSARDRHVDLILMDIDLGPGRMDGTQAAETILAEKDIPIVFLSSHTEPATVENAETITSYGYVVKDCAETILLASIRMAFRLSAAQAARLEKSKQLDTLLDNAKDHIGRLDPEGRHLYVNRALCDAMGIPEDEYVGKKMSELDVPDEPKRQWKDAIDRCVSTNQPVSIEFEICLANGRRALECKIVPEHVEGGKVRTMVAISRDVTERKEARELFTKAFHGGPLLATISSIDDGTYLELNDTFVSVTGYSREEAIGKTSVELGFIDPESRDALKEELLSTGRVAGREIFLHKKSGESMCCLFNGEIIEVNGTKRLLSLAQDISDRKRAENALRASEKHLQTLLNATPVGIYRTDINGDCVYANPAWLEMAGMTLEEALGKGWIQGLHPEDRESIGDKWYRSVQSGGTWSYEYRFVDRRGDVTWVYGNALPLHGPDGTVEGYLGTNLDITQKKMIEKDLQERQERYSTVVGTALDGFGMINGEGTILDVNEAMCRMTGYSRQELIGMAMAEVEAVESPEDVATHMETVVEKGGDRFESIHRRKNGECYPVEVSTTFVPTEGGVFLSFIRDISDRKETERMLKESEVQKRLILNSTAEMIAYYDTTLRILWANDAAATSVGKKPEELVGAHCYEIWHGRATPCDGCPVVVALERKEPCSGEVTSPDGRQWHLRGYPVLNDHGDVEALVEFGRDITAERRQTEQFEAVANHSYDWEDWIGVDGELVWVNPAVERVTGYSPQECYAMAEYPYAVFHPDDRSRARVEIRQGISTEEASSDFEARCQRKDGSETWVSVCRTPIYNKSGSLLGVRSSMRDVTAQKKAEADRAFLMQELNHRVKNNLAILASLVRLKDTSLGDAADLSDIRHHIEAIRLIHQKLYESGTVSTIEIREYVQEILTTIFTSFYSRPVTVHNGIGPSSMDPKTAISLGLMINELATNAIKHGFVDSKPAEFSVSLTTDDADGACLLRVSNTGRPFPEGVTLENPATLGLRLLSALATQLDGAMELHREPHPVFTLRFPAT